MVEKHSLAPSTKLIASFNLFFLGKIQKRPHPRPIGPNHKKLLNLLGHRQSNSSAHKTKITGKNF